MKDVNRRIAALGLAGCVALGASGCAQPDATNSQNPDASSVSDSNTEFSFVQIYDNVSVEEAKSKYGVTFADTSMYDSLNRGLFYASDAKKLIEIRDVVSGSIKKIGSTITFMIQSDSTGLYSLDIASCRITRTTVVEDIYCVPENEEEITKLSYGLIYEHKCFELYYVNGKPYMRNVSEDPEKPVYYSVEEVNSVGRYTMLAIHRKINPDDVPRDENCYLAPQYFIYDNVNNNIINIGSSTNLSGVDKNMELIAVGKDSSILFGRQTGSGEYSDIGSIYAGYFSDKNPQNNGFIDLVPELVIYRNHGNMGKPLYSFLPISNVVKIKKTSISNVYIAILESGEYAVFHADDDLRCFTSLLSCGHVSPTIEEYVDLNSKHGDVWLRIDGLETLYYNLSSREAFRETELPSKVSLVPYEEYMAGLYYNQNIAPNAEHIKLMIGHKPKYTGGRGVKEKPFVSGNFVLDELPYSFKPVKDAGVISETAVYGSGAKGKLVSDSYIRSSCLSRGRTR